MDESVCHAADQPERHHFVVVVVRPVLHELRQPLGYRVALIRREDAVTVRMVKERHDVVLYTLPPDFAAEAFHLVQVQPDLFGKPGAKLIETNVGPMWPFAAHRIKVKSHPYIPLAMRLASLTFR